MKRKAMAFLVTLAMVLSLLPFAAFAADVSYTDIAGHWGESSIERWTDEGVVNGVGNDKFKPDDNMLRAEAAAVFARLLELVKTADISQFTDVNADDWFAGYISENVAYKLMNGTSATTMDPNDFITREQFFTIFARAMGIPGQDECNKDFSDLGDVSDWAAPSVNALINLGYVNGISDTKIAPQMFITRAMVMKVLDNGISDYLTESGTYSVSGRGIVIALADNVALKGNFSGWVVGSMDNGTIDLTGVNGAPEMWILKDNVKIVKNPTKTWTTIDPSALSSRDSVGAWITTSSVAFGTVSNGKDVANDSKVVIKGHRSGGGGGGSSSYGPYTVTASLSAPVSFANLELSATFKKDANVEEIVNGLITGDNETAIKNAYSALAGYSTSKAMTLAIDTQKDLLDKAGLKLDTVNATLKAADESPIDGQYDVPGTITVSVSDSYEMSATFTPDAWPSALENVFAQAGATLPAVINIDLPYNVSNLESAYTGILNSVGNKLGVTSTSAWQNIVVACAPANLYTASGANLQLIDENDFYDLVAELAGYALDLRGEVSVAQLEAATFSVGECIVNNNPYSGQTVGDIATAEEDFVNAILGDNDVLQRFVGATTSYTAAGADYTLNSTPGPVQNIINSANDPNSGNLIQMVMELLYGTYEGEITVTQ